LHYFKHIVLKLREKKSACMRDLVVAVLVDHSKGDLSSGTKKLYFKVNLNPWLLVSSLNNKTGGSIIFQL